MILTETLQQSLKKKSHKLQDSMEIEDILFVLLCFSRQIKIFGKQRLCCLPLCPGL